MENKKYLVWYEWAEKNMNVKMIVEYYLKNHEVVKDYLNYIQDEENAKRRLIHCLSDAGFTYTDIEDIMLRYGGKIQNIYLELGIKIGAKLGAKFLI